MTVIVGIFDNAANLDRAIETLSDLGLDETVFDQSIASLAEFRTHLADHHLPGKVIESYATHFRHGGKFVLARADKPQAAEVMDLFKRCDAAQVNRHD